MSTRRSDTIQRKHVFYVDQQRCTWSEHETYMASLADKKGFSILRRNIQMINFRAWHNF